MRSRVPWAIGIIGIMAGAGTSVYGYERWKQNGYSASSGSVKQKSSFQSLVDSAGEGVVRVANMQ